MSVNRIRNRIKLDPPSRISEIALKEVRYRWSSNNNGIEILIYNVVERGDRRTSTPMITIASGGLSRSYVYSYLSDSYGIETGEYHYVIIDGTDFT